MEYNRGTYVIIIIILMIFLNCQFVSSQSGTKAINQPGSGNSFPDSINFTVQPYYRHRPDGKAGREIILNFKGSKYSGKGSIEIECAGDKESIRLNINDPIGEFPILLPPGAGVESSCTANITLKSQGHELSGTAFVSAKRQWTVYIYPHSHVDIGYTNTQENVELIHKRNLLYGIGLARKTADYPADARYLWNPEVLWPVERYLAKASPEERENIKEAVEKGYLHLDAGYIHTNTSAAADEELFEFFRQCQVMEEFTGKKIETLVQVDVPGMSWGVVPVASKLGIKYCFALNNGSDRVGHSTDLSFHPFWWLAPDGKSRMLFLQPGSYNPGAILKGFNYWPLMAGQTDTSKLLRIVKTDNPRRNFIDKYLDQKLPELENSEYYPYNIFAMSWAMADNTPIDADLPDAVRSWNEDYAYPRLVIASATKIMKTFEEKYGDQLPVYKGDFTEYWTDGLGTAARQTGMNRSSKERLIQAETLWSMLKPGIASPGNEFNEAWRNVIMGTEHTWCYMDPSKQPITDNILEVKFGFFQKADEQSRSLLKSALSDVADTASQYIGVFNTLQWNRSQLITVSASQRTRYNAVANDKGEPVLSQILSTGELSFLASDVPGFGSGKYTLQTGKDRSKSNLAEGNILDNGIIRVVIDPATGDIISLKRGSEEFVDSLSGANVNSYRYLHGEDDPWKATGTEKVRLSIKENGPLLATLRIESGAEGCNELIREISVIAGQPYIEISNLVDKKAVKEKEGIHFGFGFNIRDPVTHADIPWGIIELEKDQLPAGNRNWIAFQRWLDISDNSHGITYCSLDAPVFESGGITANILGAATNSPKWIHRLEPSATIYSWALNNHWHTNFPLSQEGKILFRYRILLHNSQYEAADANQFGLEQLQPLVTTSVMSGFNATGSMLTLDNSKIVVTVIRNGMDGTSSVLRLRSLSDKDEKVKLDWHDRKPRYISINEIGESDLKKEANDEIAIPGGGFVTLDVRW
jgi:alpha-mannosidase